jgi:hypothetical protein
MLCKKEFYSRKLELILGRVEAELGLNDHVEMLL